MLDFYKNTAEFQPSPNSIKNWTLIDYDPGDLGTIRIPSLFKFPSPKLRLKLIGVFIILGLEAYATFGVAVEQGVKITIILWLLGIDIIIAYLPYWNISKKRILENQVFENKNKIQLLPEKASVWNNALQNCEYELKSIALWHGCLKGLLVIMLVAKLYFFYDTYPFPFSYPSYIVFVCYCLGTIFHLICTGPVINYYIRFKPRLFSEYRKHLKDPADFRIDNNKPQTELLPKLGQYISDNAIGAKHNIIKTDDIFRLSCKGLLLDEDLISLASKQPNIDLQRAVLNAGKTIQLTIYQTAKPGNSIKN